MFPDWSLILNYLLATAILMAPLEFFVLRNISVFRTWMTTFLTTFSSPEHRKQLFSELAHGVLRALSERAGSLRGAAARQDQSSAITDLVSGEGGLGALGALRGKIDLPIIGKVTPIEALQLFNTLKGLMGKGGGGIPFLPTAENSSAGYPQ